MTLDTKIVLNTGAPMPMIGLGTWKSAKDKVGQAVGYALVEAGYRHIDCASVYGNEKEIGESLAAVFENGVVPRGDVFITSKLWNSAHKKDAVLVACKKTLSDLKLDYLDLYLMHWATATPGGDSEVVDENGILITEKVPIRETWEAMEDLVQSGLVKAIGVANFTAPLVCDLLSYARIPPSVNQIELHPYFQQSRLLEFLTSRNIAVTAYSPLGRPGNDDMGARLIEDETIVRIARAHKKTPAQALLRWGIQRNTVVIPKSTYPERIKENIDVFDFELSNNNMDAIGELERGLRLVDPYFWGKIPYFD